MKLKDITGCSFGNLSVLKRDGCDSTGKTAWYCMCRCGKNTTVTGLNLKSGNTTSCGCAKNQKSRRRKDISGMSFGMLTAIKPSGTRAGRSFWECICACGMLADISYINLSRGVTTSCGCYRRSNSVRYHLSRSKKSIGSWARLVVSDSFCAKCFSMENLHAHHVMPSSLHPQSRLDASNGVALCGPCHRIYHSETRLRDCTPSQFAAWLGIQGRLAMVFDLVIAYRSKGGINDLQKARNYLDEIIEGDKKNGN